MDLVGEPSAEAVYVFNGDFVDRGAWGLETFLLLASWKLACPHHVFLLRGNHETALCSMVYGFKGELVAKLGSKWKVRSGFPIGRPKVNPHGCSAGTFETPRDFGNNGRT